MKKLNLGAGEDKLEGFINIDWNDLANPDVKHDLNSVPYPFKDNEFDYIEASHVLEHLDRPFDVMKEMHRLLKPGGVLRVKVPHFSRGFTHAEHAHGFDVTFPHYFNKNFLRGGYFGVDYELESMHLKWFAFAHLMPHMGYGKTIIGVLNVIDAVVSFLANLSPALCSRLWCYWVGGFEEIEFTFTAIKGDGEA